MGGLIPLSDASLRPASFPVLVRLLYALQVQWAGLEVARWAEAGSPPWGAAFNLAVPVVLTAEADSAMAISIGDSIIEVCGTKEGQQVTVCRLYGGRMQSLRGAHCRAAKQS